MKELIQRLKARTPKFWKNVQKIGISAGVIGGAIMTAPISLPPAVVAAGGYLVTAGGVAAALSQLTQEDANAEQH